MDVSHISQRITSKGMSNICLSSSSEILGFSKLPFPMFKNSSPSHFWQTPTHTDITEFENFLLQLKNREQKCMWLFHYFNFERNYASFNKNETEVKLENPTHTFIDSLCFRSFKNRALKI